MEKRDALSDVEKFRSGRDEREKEREKKKKEMDKARQEEDSKQTGRNGHFSWRKKPEEGENSEEKSGVGVRKKRSSFHRIQTRLLESWPSFTRIFFSETELPLFNGETRKGQVFYSSRTRD